MTMARRSQEFIVQNWPILAVVIAVVAVGFSFAPSYRYQINPDATSYISIAHKYAGGDFRQAINAYWGPLLSWIAMPAFWFKIDPALYLKIFQVVMAAALSSATFALARLNNKSRLIPSLAAFAIGALGLDWGLVGPITPDLLFCVIASLLLLAELKHTPTSSSLKSKILIGVLGALLYYSKSVGFFFFGGLGLVWLASEYIFNSPRPSFSKLAKSGTATAIIFIILILPFVAAISIKYHKPTIGTAGGYNFALIGPHSKGQPIINRVLAPANNTPVSAWEDPSNLPIAKWSPLSSWSNFGYFWSTVYHNLRLIWSMLIATIAGPTILAIYYLFKRQKNPEANREKLIVALAAVWLSILYSVILVNQRYIWLLFVIAIVSTAWLAGKFPQRHRSARVLIAILLVAPIFGAWHDIAASRWAHKNFWQDSQTLTRYIGVGSRVASDNRYGLYACYYTGCQFYGVIQPSKIELVKKQVSKYKIQYLLLPDSSARSLTKSNLRLAKEPKTYFLGRHLYKVL